MRLAQFLFKFAVIGYNGESCNGETTKEKFAGISRCFRGAVSSFAKSFSNEKKFQEIMFPLSLNLTFLGEIM